MSKVVLITGCSTGIGRDLAQRLSQSDYKVVATARQVASLDDLPAALKLPLDVTRAEQVQRAVDCTLDEFGRIDVLVNNAGYAFRGALEEISGDKLQALFDTNVFGLMGVVRAVAPVMRKQGAGTIINIGSLAGKFSTPANGAYSATKFALEALSDALRHELAPFGVHVVLIEPGSIRTNFDETFKKGSLETFSNPNSPYQPLYKKYDQVSDSMRKGEQGPEAVSRIIQQAIESHNPKARYGVNFPLSARLVQFLGDPAWDLVVRQLFKIGP